MVSNQPNTSNGDIARHSRLAPPPENAATSSQPGEEVDDQKHLAIVDLVQRLQAGGIAPDDLDPAIRRQCVTFLTLQGLSTNEIADLLSITDRTVRRDRAAFRQEDALEPSLTLGDELLGEFQRLTLASVQRLTRMAADHSTPPYARLWAEDAIGRTYQRFIETVRRLQYVDTGYHRLHRLLRDAQR